MPAPLFRPTARQTNWLLIVGFLALGEALYLRYLAIEHAARSRSPARAGCKTWLCMSFRIAIALYNHQRVRLGRARRRRAQSRPAVDRPGRRSRWRPPASAWSCTMPIWPDSPSALLLLSLARPAPAADVKREREQAGAEPQRLPVGEAFVERRCRPPRAIERRRRRRSRPPAARARSAQPARLRSSGTA